mmetsp:Transcript_11524/g.23452  ORF Transcript_11524/g.23452 Transcript_11524/m.23452 type:complete len:85 (+) Transcript_11524:3346-3600(+)
MKGDDGLDGGVRRGRGRTDHSYVERFWFLRMDLILVRIPPLRLSSNPEWGIGISLGPIVGGRQSVAPAVVTCTTTPRRFRDSNA